MNVLCNEDTTSIILLITSWSFPPFFTHTPARRSQKRHKQEYCEKENLIFSQTSIFSKHFPELIFSKECLLSPRNDFLTIKSFTAHVCLTEGVDICVRHAVFCAKRDVLSSRRDASVKQKVSLPIALRKLNCGCLPYKNTGRNAQTACLKRRKTQNTDRRAATAHVLDPVM